MKKDNLTHSRTSVYNINYHIVWSVKYRRKVITPEIESYMREIVYQIADAKGFRVNEFESGNMDHVHLFVTAPPKLSPSLIIQYLKGITGRKLLEKYPELREQLWKGELWNHSTYIETIGDVSSEAIRKFLEYQSRQYWKAFVMPKARHKKTTKYQTSMTKAVFLFGYPNKGKRELLEKIQLYYTDLVNKDIEILSSQPDLTMELVKNDKKASVVGAVEKSIRPAGVNSAFCQNAFGCAFTKLANWLDAIRIDMYAENQTIFTQSKVLYAMSIMGKPQDEMAVAMDDLAAKVKKEGNRAFYQKQAADLRSMAADEFLFAQKEFTDSYLSHCLSFAVPHVDREQVSLDSRLMRLEISTNTTYPYVIHITNPFVRAERIAVPICCSRDGLRRMKQYKVSQTVRYALWGKDKIRVQASFEKKLQAPSPQKYIGVDTGMRDCFYCSDGRSIGTMGQVIAYYKDVVEPSFAGLSDLRNKKAKILHFLRKHPNLPEEIRLKLLRKVDRLEKMIRTTNLPYRKKRRYYAWLSEEVSTDVRKYLEKTGHDTLTVLERLDIKEFRKSRKLNGELSVFARGLLQEKLMSELNWHGMAFLEVEPDYSSQTCPVCGHIDAKSRNGKQFRCTLCGHTDDADHNASVVLKNRATDQEFLNACEKHKYDPKGRQAAIRAIGKKRSDAWTKANFKMMKATA